MKAIRESNTLLLFIKGIQITFLLLSLSVFCLSIDKRIYEQPEKFARTNPDEVIISYSVPEKKYIRLGELSVRFNSGYKRETALGLLKKTAAEYGANGIILNPIRRINDRFSVTSSNSEAPDANIAVVNYELSGTMYRYLSE